MTDQKKPARSAPIPPAWAIKPSHATRRLGVLADVSDDDDESGRDEVEAPRPGRGRVELRREVDRLSALLQYNLVGAEELRYVLVSTLDLVRDLIEQDDAG